MRWERLILSSGDASVTVRFHHRLTVVAGVGPLERDGLISELLGALRGPRPGTNLELVEGGGRLKVLRPSWGSGDRVLDEDGEDVTARFARPDGGVDLLAPLGLDVHGAERLCRFSTLDALAPAEEHRVIAELAARPQARLWAAADRLVSARAALETVGAEMGASAGDARAIAEVQQRHQAFEAAQDRCERVRRNGIAVGVACALGGVPAVMLDRLAAVALALVAAVFTALSVVFRRRLADAKVAEEDALKKAGAGSYGGFVHQRVATLLGDREAGRERLAAAVGEHGAALVEWAAVAGTADVDWVRARRAAIAAATSEVALSPDPPRPRVIGDHILQRITELHAVGPRGESLPLLLDEPFAGLDPDITKGLLELLVRVAGDPQIILLTERPDIAAWAEVGAAAGELGVVRPAPALATV